MNYCQVVSTPKKMCIMRTSFSLVFRGNTKSNWDKKKCEIISLAFLITILSICFILFDYKFNDFIIEKSEIRYPSILSCKIILSFILLVIVRIFAIKSTFRAIDLILYLFSPFMTKWYCIPSLQIGIAYNINSYFTYIIILVIGLTVVNAFSLILFSEASKQNMSLKYSHNKSILN